MDRVSVAETDPSGAQIFCRSRQFGSAPSSASARISELFSNESIIKYEFGLIVIIITCLTNVAALVSCLDLVLSCGYIHQ